jgi:hypothetical protein
MEKLKFLDEAHVMAKDLLSRKVLGLRNHRVYMKANTIHAARASITILISLTGIIFIINFNFEVFLYIMITGKIPMINIISWTLF